MIELYYTEDDDAISQVAKEYYEGVVTVYPFIRRLQMLNMH